MRRNFEKEKLLVEYLISSPDVFSICSGIVNPDYFAPEITPTLKFVKNYFENYKSLPDEAQILAETGVKLIKQNLTLDKIEYCTNEIESFCKKQALIEAVHKAIDVIQNDDEEAMSALDKPIKDALMVSLNREMGIDFFNGDIIQRIKNRSIKETKLPSGLTKFDELLNGGPDRKSIVIFCGASGGGKSLTLGNFALRYVLNGLNVLYISLELFDTMVDERFMTMVSACGAIEQRYKSKDISNIIDDIKTDAGRLFIKYMPVGTKPNQIESYLKELELKENIVPDVLVVDYLDLMSPNQPVSAENVFLKDKYTTEELRSLGVKYDCLTLTASQLNREARKEAMELGQHHIAGGISKINTADTVLAVDISSEKKVCNMKFLKTRSSAGVGKHIIFNFDPNFLLIENMKEDDEEFNKHVNKTFNFSSQEAGITISVDKDKNENDKLFDSLELFSDDYD